MDNFEHLVGGAAVVARWLARCDGLAVLASSRIPLHINGEREFPVAPLALPTAGASPAWDELAELSAVVLFVERARAVRPNFALTAENAPVVAAICVRLDGLPLAIELAAARVKLMPPAMLLKQLESSLNLDLLTGGAREVAPRHQTLRAAICWSYDLLDQSQQCLFRQLAVFRGGFDFESAERICGGCLCGGHDVFEGVALLLDQSLLVRRADSEEEPRFAMLETVREFALEMLESVGELETVRERHLSWCLQGAAQRNDEMRRDFGGALRRFRAEADNWRAAWSWSIEARPRQALRLAANSALLWNRCGGTTEHYERLQRALERAPADDADDDADDETRARALQYLVQTDRNRADWPRYHEHLERLETLAREADSAEFAAIALDQRMWDAVGARDIARALQLGAEILRLREQSVAEARARQLGAREIERCRNEQHDAMILHAEILAEAQRMDEAWQLMEETLALKRASGDQGGLTFGLYKYAQLLALCGRHGEAHQISEEVVRRARENGDDSLQRAYYLDDAARNALHNDRTTRARELLREAFALWKEEHAELGLLTTLGTLALLHEREANWPLWAQIVGARAAFVTASRPDFQIPTADESAAKTALGAAHFETLRQAGSQLSPQGAIELGLGSHPSSSARVNAG